jgi:predicted permease
VSIFSRLKRRLRPDDDDLQEEIRAHLAIAADDRMADGTDRRTAQLASLKDFGNVSLAMEAARAVWRPRWFEALRDQLNDVRYAVRVLAKSPAFSLTVIAILTLGIGLNAAVFTLLKSLALNPLSGVAESSRLGVLVSESAGGRRSGLSFPDYRFIRDHNESFSGLIGSAFVNASFGQGKNAERMMAELVTGNYFQVLGVGAQLGRTLQASDEVAPGQHPIAVISHALWRRVYAEDPDIVGRTVHINGYPLTVVGVADPTFHGTVVGFDVEVFVPVMMAPQIGVGSQTVSKGALEDRRARYLMVAGRLRAGATLTAAAAQTEVLSAQLASELSASETADRIKVIPIWESPYGAQTYMWPAVTVLAGMALLLLLIVCANIAGLVLVRCVSRRGEIAVRLALGASRTRVLRSLFIENLLLAIPGALLGLLLVWRGMPLLWANTAASGAPGRLFMNVAVDRLVIGFSILVAGSCATVFGVLPALRSSRVDLITAMNEDFSPRSAVRGRLRAGLVVAQVAVSLMLLVGASLVTRSLAAANLTNPGYDPSQMVSVSLDLKSSGYDETRGRDFYQRLLDAMRADRGIESAAIAATYPMTLVDFGVQRVAVDGYVPKRDEDLRFLSNVVGPDYFHTMRIHLVAGRDFEQRDDDSVVPVAIVNNTLATRFWDNATNAIGKRVRVADGRWRMVIGVAQDVKYSRVNEPPRPYVYVPFLQSYQSAMFLQARGTVPMSSLLELTRAHIAALDPDLPILDAKPLTEQTRSSLTIFEMAAQMLFLFGIAGMALAAMGIYGLVSYTVKQSTHEIGIRMALGAQGLSIVRGFVGRGLRLGAIGAGIGVVSALAVARLLSSILYGVSSTDGLSFARALGVVLGGVLIATVVPAWRATRTNPLTALRHQ